MKQLALVAIALLAGGALPATGAQLAEINLVQPLDEPRGWCVDLFAHLKNAIPLGGFQGHTCFLYMGRGPTEDQGFDVDLIRKSGKFRLDYFNVCMTMQEPRAGSYVGAEPCVDEPAQQFKLRADGRIVSASSPQLCLTLGEQSVPGGPRLSPAGANPPKTNADVHLIRRLSFETCSERPSRLQQWQLRTVYKPQRRSEPDRFLDTEGAPTASEAAKPPIL